MTVRVDSDGNGKIERRSSAAKELSRDDFSSDIKQERFRLWIWIVAVGAVAVFAFGILVRRHLVKKPVAAAR